MIPYLWHIVSLGFLAYMSQSIYSLYSLYFPAECQGRNCLKPSTDYFDPVSVKKFGLFLQLQIILHYLHSLNI